MIKASIVADSKNEFGNRITTMVVTFPRIILAEFNTHRMFSRNSASSRAIPFEKMVKSVEENPFIPIAWQKDHKGMQGTEYFTDTIVITNILDWKKARTEAINTARALSDIGVTKQLCNRLLEPFMWHTVIVTATEWENFFALRCPQYGELLLRSKKDCIKAINKQAGDRAIIKNPSDLGSDLHWLTLNKGQAEIHMMALAEAMWDAYNESIPKLLRAREWHIPYQDKIDVTGNWNDKIDSLVDKFKPIRQEVERLEIAIATVMAARTSYTVVGNDLKPLSYERIIEIHDEMLAANPKHMSPFEHCAKTMDQYLLGEGSPDHMKWSGNFKGFTQYRKLIPNENII